MIDIVAQIAATRRTVATGHSVELVRRYDADVADVWQACTDPERLARWFAPVGGDLRPGGRYAIEGNASGEILECSEPRRLRISWVFDGDSSSVELHLSDVDGATELRLVHSDLSDNDHWTKFGPAATGIGWDGALLGLWMQIRLGAGGSAVDEMAAWQTSDEAIAFTRAAGEDWRRAHVASGADEDIAAGMAQRTVAFYTGT